MEDNEQDLHLKQNYLKSEIIDKNINPDKFMNYCLTIKENGDDINSWNFEELKECVANFNELLKKESQEEKEKENMSSQNAYLSNTNQEQSQNQLSTQIISNNIQINNNNQIQPNQGKNITSISLNILQLTMNNERMRQRIDTDIQESSLLYPNLDINPNPKKREIKCKTAEKSILNDKKIKVIIQNPKNSEKSLLSSQYTLYEVCTESMKWLVQRRYSDFDWLRNILYKLFPRLFIPPIPGKKVGNRRFESDFIEKRMKFLQMFIDEIMENEELKSSEALIAFLSFNDRNQFEKKMKELNSYIPSNFCEDLKTLKGKLFILNDDFNENYYINVNNYLKLRYQILTRLNNNFKNFCLNQTKACIDLDEIQKDFKSLNILNEKVKLSSPITKTYDELSIFFENWKKIIYKENIIIKEQIKHFFKKEKLI